MLSESADAAEADAFLIRKRTRWDHVESPLQMVSVIRDGGVYDRMVGEDIDSCGAARPFHPFASVGPVAGTLGNVEASSAGLAALVVPGFARGRLLDL
jgi:hypothetical protein